MTTIHDSDIAAPPQPQVEIEVGAKHQERSSLKPSLARLEPGGKESPKRIRDWYDYIIAFTALTSLVIGSSGLPVLLAVSSKSEQNEAEVEKNRVTSSRNMALAGANDLLNEAWDALGGERYSSVIIEYTTDPRQIVKAQRLIEKAKLIAPDYGRVWVCQGVVFEATGNPAEALVAYEKAVELDPTSAVAQRSRADALHSLGDFDTSLSACDLAIRLDPEAPLAHNSRGVTLYDLGRVKEAFAAFDRAVSLNPDESFAYNNRGICFKKQGRFRDAVNDYDHAIRIDPQASVYHYNRAFALYELHDLHGALASFNLALERRPDDKDTIQSIELLLQEIRAQDGQSPP